MKKASEHTKNADVIDVKHLTNDTNKTNATVTDKLETYNTIKTYQGTTRQQHIPHHARNNLNQTRCQNNKKLPSHFALFSTSLQEDRRYHQL